MQRGVGGRADLDGEGNGRGGGFYPEFTGCRLRRAVVDASLRVNMKINAALARTLLMAASIGMVVPIQAQTSPKTKPGTTPKQQSPAVAAEGKKKEADKAAPEATEPEPVIAGSTIARADGTFLGLSVEGGNFKLSFFDAKKKPVQANVARATAMWDPVTKAGKERVVLNPVGDGTALSGPKQVRPPFVFKVYLTLLTEAGEVVESHVVDFRG